MLYVRGLGEDREWTQQMGDVAMGGVGFEYPHRPGAQKYQVSFNVPGEAEMRTATAKVVTVRPLDEASGFFIGLEFINVRSEDELALARSLDRLQSEPFILPTPAPTVRA